MTKVQTNALPLLMLRGMVVFPHTATNLDIGRPQSLQALQVALREEKEIFLLAQKDANVDAPSEEDVYDVGTIARIKHAVEMPNGHQRVVVEGIRRATVIDLTDMNEGQAVVIPVSEFAEHESLDTMKRLLLDSFETYVKGSKKISNETFFTIEGMDDASELADSIASHVPLTFAEKQKLLGMYDVEERMMALITYLKEQKELLDLDHRISVKVKRSVEKTQKEFYLREQMRAIQKELGDTAEKDDEIAEMRQKLKTSGMPETTQKAVEKEIGRYARLAPNQMESGMIRNYIEWMLALPWSTSTEDVQDAIRAREVLDNDHFGLEKVKERILEYLAVHQLNNSLRGPILCLVGPPGVGKTTLARSIATSLDRKFVRMSLGGVRDESEIRGHRRTY
ncbi:MAG: LON peptidase substrate-binding domain-containing protein, partial [Bacilli bacterium]